MREKVLIITPFYPPNIGGAETFCADLAVELSKKYSVSICTIDWKGQKIFAGTGIRQFFEVFPRLFPKAIMELSRNRPDIIYCIGLQSAAIGAILQFLFRVRCRAVLLALYEFRGIFGAISGFFIKRMEKVFVEGKNGELNLAILGIPKSKIIQFQHWCDQTVFYPAERNYGKMRVLFVGRPIPEKGKHIIEAVEKELSHLKDLEFIYVESVKHEALAEYYQMADVCVVPSLYPEGIARVVIESASCGCFVITSDRGSLPNLVEDFGAYRKPISTEFSDFIELLYRNKFAMKKWQEKTYEYAKANFSNKNAEVFLCE